MSVPPDQPTNRRGFFRALRDWAAEETQEAARPLLEDVYERYEPLLAQIQGPQLIRPPGALPESEFMRLCERCGKCIQACPDNAIVPADERAFPGKGGTPVINPRRRACHSCDGHRCAEACPTGALVPLPAGEPMNLGKASLYTSLCFAHQGETCDTCHAVCPERGKAIRMIRGMPQVFAESCTGCGMCEYACPAHPAAIRVLSRRL